MTARTVLQSLPACADVEPWQFWSDTLLDFSWRLNIGPLSPRPLDIDVMDGLYDVFGRRARTYAASAYAHARTATLNAQSMVGALGVADLRDPANPRLIVDDAVDMPAGLRSDVEGPLI